MRCRLELFAFLFLSYKFYFAYCILKVNSIVHFVLKAQLQEIRQLNRVVLFHVFQPILDFYIEYVVGLRAVYLSRVSQGANL